MNLFTGKIVQAICWTLLHSLWQGLLLAVVTGIVMVLSKKSGSALRYKLLSAMFIAFIVITGITFYQQLSAAQVVAGTNNSALPANAAKVVAQPAAIHVTATVQTSNNLQYYIRQFVNYFDEHASLIVTIWFIIFMARCVKILSGLVHIQRIRHYKTSAAPAFWEERIKELAARLNIKKHILLLQSALIKVPAVVGFLKPTILVPIGLLNSLSQEEVESILMHELAHVRRKDYLFNLLQCFIDIMFFFNPAVLWVSSLIRNERENCCDDIAIHQTKNKKQFIQALVSFHQYNAAAPKYAMPFAERKNKLVDRVKRIVNNNNTTLKPGEKAVLVGCMLAFGITFFTISNGQTDETKKKPKQTTTNNKTTGDNGQKKPAPKENPKPQVNINNEQTVDNDFDINYQALGYKNISVDKLIELRDHGVSASYIKELNNAGYKNVSLDEAIELKNHGVSIEYINELGGAGYKNLKLDKVIEARDHGVNIEYVTELNNMGYKNLTLDNVIEARDHGVNIEFVKELATAGYKNLSLEQVTELTNHGVNLEYIKELDGAGYKNLNLNQVMEAREHGVNIEFIKQMQNAGYKNLSLDMAIELQDHGVNAAYITELKNEGATNLTLEKALQYRDEGLNAEYLNGLRKAGYTNIDLDKAMEARSHGVTVTYINSFKKFGFDNISLDKAIELQDHGVTAAFIEKMKTKTGSYFSLDEYIRLKDSGFDGK